MLCAISCIDKIDFHEAADGVAQENLVGGFEVGREESFLDRVACIDEVSPEDAGQQARIDGRRAKCVAVAQHDVGDSAFGQLAALVGEKYVEVSEFPVRIEFTVVKVSECCFVPKERIGGENCLL